MYVCMYIYTHIYIYTHTYPSSYICIRPGTPDRAHPGPPPERISDSPGCLEAPPGLLGRPCKGFLRHSGLLGGSKEASNIAQDSSSTAPNHTKTLHMASKRPKKPPRGFPRGPPKAKFIDFSIVFACFLDSRLFGFPTLQDGPSGPQDRPKKPPKRAPRRPKSRPRRPKRVPRRPQEGPKRGNANRQFERSAPRGPQEAPRGPQEAPRGPQEYPRRHAHVYLH